MFVVQDTFKLHGVLGVPVLSLHITAYHHYNNICFILTAEIGNKPGTFWVLILDANNQTIREGHPSSEVDG